MSVPVDVLRYNAAEATKKWGPDNQDTATFSAFVELIQAAGAVDFHQEEATHEQFDRLRAALARVTGGAA